MILKGAGKAYWSISGVYLKDDDTQFTKGRSEVVKTGSPFFTACQAKAVLAVVCD